MDDVGRWLKLNQTLRLLKIHKARIPSHRFYTFNPQWQVIQQM